MQALCTEIKLKHRLLTCLAERHHRAKAEVQAEKRDRLLFGRSGLSAWSSSSMPRSALRQQVLCILWAIIVSLRIYEFGR